MIRTTKLIAVANFSPPAAERSAVDPRRRSVPVSGADRPSFDVAQFACVADEPGGRTRPSYASAPRAANRYTPLTATWER